MRKLLIICILACTLTACADGGQASLSGSAPAAPSAEQTTSRVNGTEHIQTMPSLAETEDNEMKPKTLQLSIDGTPVRVDWESNRTMQELSALAERGTIRLQTSAYGGFEQVGPLPESLFREDVQLTTVPGDIVLYSGDQIVLFYGSNSWSYTKLGHIEDLTESQLAELLNKSSVTVEIAVH